MIAAVLTLPSVALMETNATGVERTIGQVLNWGIWLAFLGEMIVMLYLVPDRRKYLRHHPLELAILIFTPPVLPASLQGIRALRLLRLLRLARLAQFGRRVFSNEGLAYAALMTLLADRASLPAVLKK